MDNIFGSQGGALGGIQTMGIISALKTGNVVIDMIIAMALPILIGFLINSIHNVHQKILSIDWMKFFGRNSHVHERFIRHSTITNSTYGSSTDLDGGDSQNEVLMKAIQLYLDHQGLLKLKNANVELRSVEEKKDNYYDSYYGYGESKSTSMADTLSRYKIVKRPMTNHWISLGKFNNGEDRKKGNNTIEQHKVELVVKEDKEDIGGENNQSSLSHRCERTLHFRSEGKQSIDNFINKAYEWYLDELRKLDDNSRYMYELVSPKKESVDGDITNEKYKRYQLSDEKTFDSLFFQQKEKVLNIVNHFVNKTGKYAIKGYPHKLGLLLHGPPGTGKTSLIKALAERTGRSIVNVSLARISTNAELASIFFDQTYYVEGESVPVNLGFKDVIFVVEDIDAVSKVVRRRDGKKTADVTYTEQIEMPIKKSLWTMLLESTNDSCQELVKLLLEKSERLKEAAQSSTALMLAAQKIGAVPGLSLVGEDNENETVKKVATEAVESTQKMLSDVNAIDEFLGSHARSLKQMIDTGAEVNEGFENELLGLSVNGKPGLESFISVSAQPSLSRQVSIKQYGEKEDAHIETSDVTSFDEMDFMAETMMNEKDSDNGFDSTESGGKKESGAMCGIGPSYLKKKKDELNLSGILNVLDGVVDTPGRMLVITSNHPEMLDPALIRPGRIDKKLLLGYMTPVDLINMVEHYFQISLDEKQKQRLVTAVNGSSLSSSPHLKLTPAQVEQMASEFDEIEEMIAAVEQKSSHVPNKNSKNNKLIMYGV